MGWQSHVELTPGVGTRAVTVRVNRQFSTAVESLFDAWLDPVAAGSILFAGDAGEVVRAEIDARVGGRFRFVRRENGTQVRWVGEYLALDRPQMLAFSLGDHRSASAEERVTIELASVCPGALLVLTHEMGLERYGQRHRIESEWRRRLGILAYLCPTLRAADFHRLQQPRGTPA